MTNVFTHFVGIDWSGAKGKRHAGLAVAVCDAVMGQTKLIGPPDGKRNWSREGCADWISAGCDLDGSARVLVGLDSSFSMPFMDEESYIPNKSVALDAKQLWQAIDTVCATASDLFGGPFVEEHSSHYLRPNSRGENFSRRMRVAEDIAVSSGAGPCESVFHLIGPSQVGMSGLSTMRMLAQLNAHDYIAIWPYDEIGGARIVLVEIYAAAFAALGGHKGKVRDNRTLKEILTELDAIMPSESSQEFSDHACDALITAAALRKIAIDRKYWNPNQLSSKVRRTEGWIFGVI
ncbi:MAG: hypothetical protein AB3N28_13505 [Kordiimonas sp.]